MIYLTQQALEKDFGLNLGSTMPFREALKRVNVHNLLLNGDKKHQ